MRPNVKVMLFSAIFVTAVLPLVAALFFVDRTLQKSLDLGFNDEIVTVLADASSNLRRLKTLDPQQAEHYRAQFNETERLRHVYAEPGLIKSSLLGSLKIYFALGLLTTVAASIAIAFMLSRRIASEYDRAYAELKREQDRVRYLEEISSWQEMAKMLAHEIKNPLTPIEVLVTSLTKSFAKKSADEFREQLKQTERMIGEELGHLKNTVIKFSEFSRLPQVVLVEQNLTAVVEQHIAALTSLFDADIELQTEASNRAICVGLDSTLFRQVIANIVRNGIEANPDRRTRFVITQSTRDDRAQLLIENDGSPVPTGLAPRIFDPYISSKPGGQNMGLGLAIVKKIIIEHGGDIRYVEREGRPGFLISLPRIG